MFTLDAPCTLVTVLVTSKRGFAAAVLLQLSLPLTLIAGSTTDILGRLPLLWLVAGSRRWSWGRAEEEGHRERKCEKENAWMQSTDNRELAKFSLWMDSSTNNLKWSEWIQSLVCWSTYFFAFDPFRTQLKIWAMHYHQLQEQKQQKKIYKLNKQKFKKTKTWMTHDNSE